MDPDVHVGRSLRQIAVRRFFRHKLAVVSLVLLILIFLIGVFANAIAPYEYDEVDFGAAQMGPTLEGQHFFGTDQLGRDYFSRVLLAIRTSAVVALLVALLSTAIGTLVGAVAGYFGGKLETVLMGGTDLFLIIPMLPVLLVASTLMGNGNQYRVALILSLFLWTTIARVVRATSLSLREKEYVEAARALGARDSRIIGRHILPNTMGPIIVNATLMVSNAILLEATLSYLGLGIRPPTPALGDLIAKGQGSLTTMPWLVTFPGITIVLICLCVNFIGDGMRDALDPTQRSAGLT